jgi:hypothetical protein
MEMDSCTVVDSLRHLRSIRCFLPCDVVRPKGYPMTPILTPIKAESFPVAIEHRAQEDKKNIIAASSAIKSVMEPMGQEQAVLTLRAVNQLLKAAESSRTSVKAPVLEIGRKIDALVKEFCLDLESESSRLGRLLTVYQVEQDRIAREAEARRQAELRRVEDERRRLEEDERKKQWQREYEAKQAAEKAERERQAELARIAEAKAKAEREALELIQRAKERDQRLRESEENQNLAPSTVARVAQSAQAAAAKVTEAQREIKALEALERETAAAVHQPAQLSVDEVMEQQSRKNEAARLAAQTAELQKQTIAAPAKAQGQVVRKVKRFEVLSLTTLAASCPNLCRIEPNTAAINAAIRAGVSGIPGLRIWEEIDTNVR